MFEAEVKEGEGEIQVLDFSASEDANAGVKAFLQSYCDATVARRYAVLLAGPWGSGKTFFLKNFLNEHDIPHIYVSLYGVGSLADIEHQIFAQLHPVLASKQVKVLGILARAFLKGALKIDFNADGNDDGSLSFSMPEAKLEEFARSAAGRVLVFDDLERAVMDKAGILGFINAFVEHEDMKAIVVANDVEIDRTDKEFRRIKEKLIGQTLRVIPSVREAYPALLKLIEDEWAREFLRHQMEDVLEVFSKSKAQNLRLLKQALWDFERLAATLRPTDKVHTAAIIKVMKALIALSIDTRAGRIHGEDLRELEGNRWARYLGGNKDKEPSPFQQTEDRYVGIDLRQSHLQADLITALLIDGHVAPAAVAESLDRSPPFIPDEGEASWRKAWRGWESTDEEFEAAMTEFEADLAALKFEEPGIVLHAFGLLIQAAEIGREGYTLTKALARGKDYVDRLEKAGKIQFPVGPPTRLQIDSGFAGLAFMSRETITFSKLCTYYEAAVERAWKANLPAVAAELLQLLAKEPELFAGAVSIARGGLGQYRNIPVLHHIKPADFVKALLGGKSAQQALVLQALGERYRADELTVNQEERTWLRAVRKELLATISGLGDMSRYRLKAQIARHISPLLAPPKKAEASAD